MDPLRRAEDLKRRVEDYNRKVAVQEAMYDKFISDLEALGLTPETLQGRLNELETLVEEKNKELNEYLDEIEERLDGSKR